MDNKIEQNTGYNLERRVSLIEYKMDEFPNKLHDFSEKIEKHEKKSEELWARMVQCLEDIKDEISTFKMTKIEDHSNIRREIQELKTKVELLENTGKSVWKTVTIVSIIVTALLSTGYNLIKDINSFKQQQFTQQRG